MRRAGFVLSAALAALAAACAAPDGTGPAPGPTPASAPIETPDELVGLAAPEVEARLGEPVFVRRDGRAEIWQYAGPDCLLDVFLYRETAGHSVHHAELRRREGRELDDAACLADALRGRG